MISTTIIATFLLASSVKPETSFYATNPERNAKQTECDATPDHIWVFGKVDFLNKKSRKGTELCDGYACIPLPTQEAGTPDVVGCSDLLLFDWFDGACRSKESCLNAGHGWRSKRDGEGGRCVTLSKINSYKRRKNCLDVEGADWFDGKCLTKDQCIASTKSHWRHDKCRGIAQTKKLCEQEWYQTWYNGACHNKDACRLDENKDWFNTTQLGCYGQTECENKPNNWAWVTTEWDSSYIIKPWYRESFTICQPQTEETCNTEKRWRWWSTVGGVQVNECRRDPDQKDACLNFPFIPNNNVYSSAWHRTIRGRNRVHEICEVTCMDGSRASGNECVEGSKGERNFWFGAKTKVTDKWASQMQ